VVDRESKRTLKAHRRRRRRLNVRLLAGSLVAGCAVSFALYFWHQHQLGNLASALAERARQLEADGQWSRAASVLHRYWTIKPEPEILARLAVAYDKARRRGSQQPVINLYYRAIGLSPQRVDLRERLAELLVGAGEYSSARAQAETALAADPTSAQARKWQALALCGQYRTGQPVGVGQAMDALTQASRALPADVQLAETLAWFCLDESAGGRAHGSRRIEAGAQVLGHLIEAAPDDPLAYLARHRYRSQAGIPGATDDLLRALELAPDNATILGTAAEAARRQSDWHAARGLFEKLTHLAPGYGPAYEGLGEVEYLLGNQAAALQVWQRGLDADPDNISLMLRIAEASTEFGKLGEAAAALRKLDQILATLATTGSETHRTWAVAGANLVRAKWQIASGDDEAAIPALRLTAANAANIKGPEVRSIPLSLHACRLLGQVYGRLGRWEEAAASYDRALRMRHDLAEIGLASAKAWQRAGQIDKAILRCEQVTAEEASAPAEAWLLLAQLQLERQLTVPAAERRWEGFESAFELARLRHPTAWQVQLLEADYLLVRNREEARDQALEILDRLDPPPADAVPMGHQLAVIYASMGLMDKAKAALDQCDVLDPASPAARVALADLHMLCGRFDLAERVLDTVPEERQSADATAVENARRRLALIRDGYSAACPGLRQAVTAGDAGQRFACLLAELAVLAGDDETLATCVERLPDRTGGDDANRQYWKALRLLASVDSTADADWGAALLEVSALRTMRPGSAKAYHLAGMLAELRGNPQAALAEYRAVFRNGVRSLMVGERALRLLLANDCFATAHREIQQWSQRPTFARTCLGGTAEMVLDQVRYQVALSRARQQADQTGAAGGSAVPYAWLLLLANRPAEAEAFIRQRAGDCPDDVALQMAQVACLASRGQALVARPLVDRLSQEECPWPSDSTRHFVLGQARELVGDLALARDHYQRVDESGLAGEEAEERLEGLEVAPGGPPGHLTQSTDGQSITPVASPMPDTRRLESRLEAVLLALQGDDAELVQARSLLESVLDAGPATAEDHALLALVRRRIEDRAADSASQDPDRLRPAPVAAAADPSVSHVVTETIHAGLRGLPEETFPEIAALLARILTYADPPNAPGAATQYVDRALKRYPEHSPLLFAAGNLRIKQGRNGQAIALLSRATQVSPDHFSAWNNLAALLAEEAGRETEALQAIEQALLMSGDHVPTLLDTKAVVLLRLGRNLEAADLLRRVTQTARDPDPRYLFHLAIALDRLGLRGEAQAAWAEAMDQGLEKTFLTGQERASLANLGERYAGYGHR
jgi:tetratricopeptide (TPR) repeat protein